MFGHHVFKHGIRSLQYRWTQWTLERCLTMHVFHMSPQAGPPCEALVTQFTRYLLWWGSLWIWNDIIIRFSNLGIEMMYINGITYWYTRYRHYIILAGNSFILLHSPVSSCSVKFPHFPGSHDKPIVNILYQQWSTQCKDLLSAADEHHIENWNIIEELSLPVGQFTQVTQTLQDKHSYRQ